MPPPLPLGHDPPRCVWDSARRIYKERVIHTLQKYPTSSLPIAHTRLSRRPRLRRACVLACAGRELGCPSRRLCLKFQTQHAAVETEVYMLYEYMSWFLRILWLCCWIPRGRSSLLFAWNRGHVAILVSTLRFNIYGFCSSYGVESEKWRRCVLCVS
jgi:hypothetical protein